MNNTSIIKDFNGFPGIIKYEEIPIHFDNRGFFTELWNSEINETLPKDFKVIQENLSNSGINVARGLHFQDGDAKQSKFIQVLDGMVLDFWYRLDTPKAWKPEYGTIGKFGCTWLYRGKALFLPNNYAHGFVACNPNTKFLYKVDAPYSPANAKTINFKSMVLDFLKDFDKWNTAIEKLNLCDKTFFDYIYDAKKSKEWLNTLLDAHCTMDSWEMSEVDKNAPGMVPISQSDFQK